MDFHGLIPLIGPNMGRAFIPGFDYSKALKAHYDPTSAKSKMHQLHEWMQIKETDNKTRQEKGFDEAYDLRVWNSFPGDAPDTKGVVLQSGLLGCHGGPTKSSAEFAAKLIEEVKIKNSS